MKLVEIKLYLISYIGKLGFEDTVFIEANSISEAEKTRFCFIDELAGKKIGLWN